MIIEGKWIIEDNHISLIKNMSSAEERRKKRQAKILARKNKGEEALAKSLLSNNIQELNSTAEVSSELKKES